MELIFILFFSSVLLHLLIRERRIAHIATPLITTAVIVVMMSQTEPLWVIGIPLTVVFCTISSITAGIFVKLLPEIRDGLFRK